MLSYIIALFVVVFDQLSKIAVLKYLKPVGSIDLIENVLRFTYVENRGAAFGMFSDNRYVFMIASVAILVLLCFAIYKLRGQKKMCGVCLGLILGGGIGNMIDRVRLAYVVDFIDFCAFYFWKYVFNIADCAVVVGCILFIIMIMFDKNFLQDKNSDRGDKNE